MSRLNSSPGNTKTFQGTRKPTIINCNTHSGLSQMIVHLQYDTVHTVKFVPSCCTSTCQILTIPKYLLVFQFPVQFESKSDRPNSSLDTYHHGNQLVVTKGTIYIELQVTENKMKQCSIVCK